MPSSGWPTTRWAQGLEVDGDVGQLGHGRSARGRGGRRYRPPLRFPRGSVPLHVYYRGGIHMLDQQTRARIESAIKDNDLVVFMKGNRSMPQCGFSGRVVQILDSLVDDYTTVDVLADSGDPRRDQGVLVVADDPADLPEGRVPRRLRHRQRDVRHRRAAREARTPGAGARRADGDDHRRGGEAHPRVSRARAGQGSQAVDRRPLQRLDGPGAARGARRRLRVERHHRLHGRLHRRARQRDHDRSRRVGRPAPPSRSTTRTRPARSSRSAPPS